METVHITTVIGSVFGNVTQYISGGELNAQKQELNAGAPCAAEASEAPTDGAAQSLPEAFTSEGAARVLGQLVEAGLTDARWQPQGLSLAERGVLAEYLAERLGIEARWQAFGSLWGVKPETLRAAFNKALDKNKTLAFQERLKGVLM